MAKTIRRPSNTQQMKVGIKGEVTKYANADTYNALQTKNVDGFNYAKIWFLPGKIQDTIFENVAFGSYEGLPDVEKPIAKFTVENKNGVMTLKDKFFDHYANVMHAWKDAVDAEDGNIKRARERISTAAIVGSSDIDATKNLGILSRVLGLQTRSYFLNLLVTMIPSANLVFSVDTMTDGSVAGMVSELGEPKLIPHTETRATNVLYKNIGHIAISEEAKLKGSHNTMALRQDKTLRDLARLINSQIGTVGETATGVAGADWGAVSGTPPDSTNNPISDLEGVMTTIEGLGFNVDYIAGHNRPITDLLTNKFIRGRGNVGIGTNVLATNTPTEPGLVGIVKDQALTNTVALVGSKDAIWLGQGPTTIASYMNDIVGYEGWLAKQWWLPIIANAAGIRKSTGISA